MNAGSTFAQQVSARSLVRACVKCSVLEPFAGISPGACEQCWGVPCLFGQRRVPVLVENPHMVDDSQLDLTAAMSQLQRAILEGDAELAARAKWWLSAVVDARNRGVPAPPAEDFCGPLPSNLAPAQRSSTGEADPTELTHDTEVFDASLYTPPETGPVPKAALMARPSTRIGRTQAQGDSSHEQHRPRADTEWTYDDFQP
eukprot:14119470-Alexandrium_andersonii.AAC.1